MRTTDVFTTLPKTASRDAAGGAAARSLPGRGPESAAARAAPHASQTPNRMVSSAGCNPTRLQGDAQRRREDAVGRDAAKRRPATGAAHWKGSKGFESHGKEMLHLRQGTIGRKQRQPRQQQDPAPLASQPATGPGPGERRGAAPPGLYAVSSVGQGREGRLNPARASDLALDPTRLEDSLHPGDVL